jgi:hypothetical protein
LFLRFESGCARSVEDRSSSEEGFAWALFF